MMVVRLLLKAEYRDARSLPGNILLRPAWVKALTSRRNSMVNDRSPTASLPDLQHPRRLKAQVLGKVLKFYRQSRFRGYKLQRRTRTQQINSISDPICIDHTDADR